ncbi:GNAT superfamily N-acetyltransferase [Elusimicrobium simillimum]
MTIEKITSNKKQFLPLLLLADEHESMIDKYLENGDMFALNDNGVKSICVVLPIEKDTVELKNIATYPQEQGKGYATALIKHICGYYKDKYQTMLVGGYTWHTGIL